MITLGKEEWCHLLSLAEGLQNIQRIIKVPQEVLSNGKAHPAGALVSTQHEKLMSGHLKQDLEGSRRF